jgi:hypothetical protein
MYDVWDGLVPQRRHEMWVLELARSVGTKQKEVDKLLESQHNLKQEVENLKAQIDHLNRLQQPREFKILTPTTVPMDKNLVGFLLEEGVVNGRRGVGLSLDDRHSDLNTLVSKAIERWKHVVVSTRSASGMSAQRPLEQSGTAPIIKSPVAPAPAASGTPTDLAPSVNGSSTSSLQKAAESKQVSTPKRPSKAKQSKAAKNTNGPATSPRKANPPPEAAQPSPVQIEEPLAPTAPVEEIQADEDDEMSDQDADAEMEDEDSLGFQAMNAPVPVLQETQPPQPVAATPVKQSGQLEVQRTRGTSNQQQRVNGKLNTGQQPSRNVSHAGRTVSGINQGIQGYANQHANQLGMAGHGQVRALHADMGMTLQEVGGGGDPMYMD